MEKNTVLAIVLSSLVLIASFIFQGIFYPPPVETRAPLDAQTSADAGNESQATPSFAEPQTASPQAPQSSGLFADLFGSDTTDSVASRSGQETVVPQEYVTIDTELLTVLLTNTGGDIVSLKLKDHFDKNENVDMIFSGNNETYATRAFSIAFGDQDADPVSENFHVTRISDYIVEFHRDFTIGTSGGMEEKFRMIKRYEFKPRDYMFELTVILDGGFSKNNFNFSGNAYTLSFGPQIGPQFTKLDNNHEYRHFFTFVNGKRKNVKLNEIIDTRPAWAAITGKYFTFISIPYLAQYSMSFSDKAEPGLPTASRYNLLRPAANISKIEDTYRFYLGPRTQDVLKHYNTGNNEFNMKDAKLDEVSSSRGILAPLEILLKWLLVMFYGVVKNYGVAIILLTLLIKILFFPLTKKGSEATLRMQALAPKMKELQEKYKNDQKKLQMEMGKFYQQEGYNPISGCLPMLLQLPIFIAMYSLFNNHFDLRGAMFIPGWIPDLSVPEVIVSFPGNFTLPFLGGALRGLPFLYVGSQLLYGKVTQMPGQQSNAQMKMMLYVMPIVFFFVLYNMPSGLLIYWIFSNLLTLVQQLIINKFIIAKRAAQEKAEPPPPPVSVPKKKKK